MIAESMQQVIEFANTWMWLVLLAAWRTLPVLIVVIGIGLVLRRKLAPSFQALLFTIVLIRLLMPFSVGSPFSLHQPIDTWFALKSDVQVDRPVLGIGGIQVPDWRPFIDRAAELDDIKRTKMRPAVIDMSWEKILWMAMLFTLVSISIGLLLRGVLAHVRFAWQLRSCRELNQQSLIDMLLHECDSLSVGRRPKVREVPPLTAPAVFGLFRPTICLPQDFLATLSNEELRWVVRHELAHIRRRDIPVMTLASIACSFHWFNPIVWLIVSRLRVVIEAAADQLAVAKLSKRDAAAYGSLLLRLAGNNIDARSIPSLGLISFASGKHLKMRVKLLTHNDNSDGSTKRVLIASLVALVALVSLTDGKEAAERMPDLHLLDENSIVWSRSQSMFDDTLQSKDGDGPSFVETYDVESIFATMPQSFVDSNKSRQEQLAAWLPLPPSIKNKWQVDGTILSADLTARQHQRLKQVLEIWKAGEPKQVSIESRIIRTDIKTASSIDWTGRKIDGLIVRGRGPALAARIDEPVLASLIRTVNEDRKGNFLFAPKVTLFDGQSAGIADQVQRPFVTNVDSIADGKVQPVVSIVNEGLRFNLTPRIGDDNSVLLSFEMLISSVGKVSYANLPIKSVTDAPPQLTVQVPAIEQCEVSSSAKLAPGESIVLAIPQVFNHEPGADANTTLIVALTPRVIATQESQEVTVSNR